jgi:hypothetical protein
VDERRAERIERMRENLKANAATGNPSSNEDGGRSLWKEAERVFSPRISDPPSEDQKPYHSAPPQIVSSLPKTADELRIERIERMRENLKTRDSPARTNDRGLSM